MLIMVSAVTEKTKKPSALDTFETNSDLSGQKRLGDSFNHKGKKINVSETSSDLDDVTSNGIDELQYVVEHQIDVEGSETKALDAALDQYSIGVKIEITRLDRIVRNFLFFKRAKILRLKVREIYFQDGYFDKNQINIEYTIGGLIQIRELLNLEKSLLLYLYRITAVDYKGDLREFVSVNLSRP